MNYTQFTAWLFDLDGTLVDSMSGVVECMKVTAKEMGGEVTDEVELRASFGKGLVNTLVPWVPEGTVNLAIERYQQNFPKYVKATVRLLPGAEELLDKIRNSDLPMGIVTGNKVFEAEGIFEALDLERWFEFENCICADSIPHQKPSPEPVMEACRRLGVEPSKEVVFIGDSEHDVRAGLLAGVSTIGVLGGSSPEDRLRVAEPDVVVSSLLEVVEGL
jgi:pyrophosphatase PpaX